MFTTYAAAEPTPTQTQGAVENAVATGITLTAVLLGIVLLVVIVAVMARFKGRRAPAARHTDRPFANP